MMVSESSGEVTLKVSLKELRHISLSLSDAALSRKNSASGYKRLGKSWDETRKQDESLVEIYSALNDPIATLLADLY